MQNQDHLNELTELLRKATTGAEDMVSQWELEDSEYMSLELLETIKKARQLLQVLDTNKAIQEE